MQPELARLDAGELAVDTWWLPSLSALESVLERLHQHLAQIDRELQQARADYRRLLDLNRSQPHDPLRAMGAFQRLTQQERRVATLAASGRSNVDIAAQLHVTVHTVKSQMGSILRKLDLRSRWELEHVLREGRSSFEG